MNMDIAMSAPLGARKEQIRGAAMTLKDAAEGREYLIERIETDDEELNSFLFSLGCYSGEMITLVRRTKSACVVSIKDGRYTIDSNLAEAIKIA